MPADTTPVAGTTLDPHARLAWLLVSSRMLGPTPVFPQRSQLVTHLKGQGLAADLSRVSRWESGSHQVPIRVLLSYESGLGVPTGSLVAMSRTLERAAAGANAVPTYVGMSAEEARAGDQVLDGLVRRASDEPPYADRPVLRGDQWLHLAVELTRFDAVFLDRVLWTRLSHRLLAELARTSGIDQLRRYEACATLITHPVARRPMLRALGEWLTDPDVQIVQPMVSLLTEVADPAADELVIRLMNSRLGMMSDGAVGVAAAKLVRGHFDEASVARLESFVVTRLRGAPHRPSTALLDLTAHLPEPALGRVLAQLASDQLRKRLASPTHRRSLLSPDTARGVNRTMTASVRDRTAGARAVDADPMLSRLLHEMIFHVSGTRRRLASRMLALSPYAEAVTSATMDLAGGPNGTLAGLAWESLEPLSHTYPREEIVTKVLDEQRPDVLPTALAVLGVMPGRLSADECDAVSVRAEASPHEPVRVATAGVFGLSAPDRLDRLPTTTDTLARAADWWRRLGPSLSDPPDHGFPTTSADPGPDLPR